MDGRKELLDYIKKAKTFLKKLEEEITKPSQTVKEVAGLGIGLATTKNILKIESDFKGIYIFFENKKPMYVGISKKVISRLQSHVKSKSHYSGSLAYKIAKEQIDIDKTRDMAMKDPKFIKVFNDAQKRILDWRYITHKIEDDNLLYFLEFITARYFNTIYNSFETH